MEAERLESSEGLPYLLLRPREVPAEGAPLIVFLHGRGERIQPGEDPDELLYKHSIPALARRGLLPDLDGRPFPFLVACPQTVHKKWKADLARVASLADELVDREGARRDRRYVTGISMGATGAWRVAARSPETFAAVVPVSAGIPWTARRVRAPVWVWIGGDDHFTRDKPVRETLEKRRRGRGPTEFTCVPGAKHEGEFWDDVYCRPELYEWLLRWTA